MPKKTSRVRCLLRVKGLVTCFYLGWSGSIFQFRQNMIKVGSKSWLLACTSNITLSLPSYTGSALKRELNFCNDYLSLLGFFSRPMTSWNLAENCLRNDDCLTIARQLPDNNCLKTPPNNCLTTTWIIHEDCSITVWQLLDACLTNSRRLMMISKNSLMTDW